MLELHGRYQASGFPRCFLSVIASLFALLFLCFWGYQNSYALDVTLEWNENTEPYLEGYLLCHGEFSGEYSSCEKIQGNVTQHTIEDLQDGRTYHFAVKAYGNGIESEFSDEVIFDSESRIEDQMVIDNGDPETFSTGTWEVSGGSDPYGSESLWSRDGSTYTWSFTPAVSGKHEVSMWWTQWDSRSTSIPVEIDHSTGTAAVYVDQSKNGGQWNSLGTYHLEAGYTYNVTIFAQPDPSSTCADAVKFFLSSSDL